MSTAAVLRRRRLTSALLLLLPSRSTVTSASTSDQRCISLTTRYHHPAMRHVSRNVTTVPKKRRLEDSSPLHVPPVESTPPKKEVALPQRKIATEPYTWDDLVDIILHKKDLSLLTRSAEQERVYQLYRKELNERWKSVYDHILHSKFGFERRVYSVVSDDKEGVDLDVATDNSEPPESPTDDDSDDDSPTPPGVLWEAHPPLSEFRETRLTLCLNDFPYYMPPNIEHWCLWKIGGDVTPEEIEEAKAELRRRMGRGEILDVLHWVNPPHLKSLPDIDHAHILCLRSANNECGADS